MQRPGRREIIEQLKLEREILLKGEYGRSTRMPWKTPEYFRDSVTCLNFGEIVRQHPCDECFLIDYVRPESRQAHVPCHHIELNDHGETIAKLDDEKDRARAERALLHWIDSEIARLEKQEAGESPSEED